MLKGKCRIKKTGLHKALTIFPAKERMIAKRYMLNNGGLLYSLANIIKVS